MAIFRMHIAIVLLLFLVSSFASSGPGATAQHMGVPVVKVGQKVWCVAKPAAPENLLSQNLNFACGENGVDCSQLQQGGSCFNPNNVIAHASYAMNMYYQANGRNSWNCDFDNTGLEVMSDPSFGSCNYPAQ